MKRTVAFFSYTRVDDVGSSNLLSKIRRHLEQRVRIQYGFDVEVFQDTDDIKIGDNWRNKLESALNEALYFIPIITPSFFNSQACRGELSAFLKKAVDSGRNDLILPILFVQPHLLTGDEKNSWDHLEKAVERVQWADWSPHSVKTKLTPSLRKDIDDLAKHLAEKLRRDDIDTATKTNEAANASLTPEEDKPTPEKQSLSHGRKKRVVVETKRKRVVVPKPGVGSDKVGGRQKRPAGISDAELERRMKALAAAKAREAEESKRREKEERVRVEERKSGQFETKKTDFVVGSNGEAQPAPDVKRSFSHGRTKNVVVETKRKRVVVPKPGVGSDKASGRQKRPAGISDAELERRIKALAAAKAREVEETKRSEKEERVRVEERKKGRADAEKKGD